VLTILDDLPDEDIEPPKTVLFVCKLNPVTQEHDLELIFSRFGPIKSCEVIRDWKTGDSLQYAFIEYETESACIDAYTKMDNVLIDERRIHVDFS
jgi:peptidyl-prolyl cis-trans isomerase-like 4